MNIGMISAGGMIMKPVRQQLIRKGHRCQCYAFCSTFFAGADRLDYNLVVVNWMAKGLETPKIIERLRNSLGEDIQFLVIHVPDKAERPPEIHPSFWLYGPISTNRLVNKIESFDCSESEQALPSYRVC